MISLFFDLFNQPMKTHKATTPTSIAQKVTGPLPPTQMEAPTPMEIIQIPLILMPRPLPTAARRLLRGSTAYQ